MIRTYCLDFEKDWDEGVHLLLFAARKAVQETLGFSPFELVFGRTVRGPFKLLKKSSGMMKMTQTFWTMFPNSSIGSTGRVRLQGKI